MIQATYLNILIDDLDSLGLAEGNLYSYLLMIGDLSRLVYPRHAPFVYSSCLACNGSFARLYVNSISDRRKTVGMKPA